MGRRFLRAKIVKQLNCEKSGSKMGFHHWLELGPKVGRKWVSGANFVKKKPLKPTLDPLLGRFQPMMKNPSLTLFCHSVVPNQLSADFGPEGPPTHYNSRSAFTLQTHTPQIRGVKISPPKFRK